MSILMAVTANKRHISFNAFFHCVASPFCSFVTTYHSIMCIHSLIEAVGKCAAEFVGEDLYTLFLSAAGLSAWFLIPLV